MAEINLSGARNNNLVADSDLKAAVATIQKRLKEKANDETRQLLTDCANSLTGKIQKVVQPISNEAFHVYVSRFKDDSVSCPSDEQNASPLAKDFSFEDEELIDQEAAKRVQELRQQVRERAAAIQELRNGILEVAVSIAERQLNVWSKKRASSNAVDADALLEQHKGTIQGMKDSLETMNAELEKTGNLLPAKMQSFQETLQEIETSLNKEPSHVDKAIYIREKVNDDETTEELKALPPDQLLANLLCRD